MLIIILENCNQLVTNLIEWSYFHYIVRVTILIFVIKKICKISTWLYNVVKRITIFCSDEIRNKKIKTILNENQLEIDINEKYESAPLVQNRNFFMANRIFDKSTKKVYSSYGNNYILLLKTFIILTIHPKNVSNFFQGSRVMKECSEETCEGIKVIATSLVIIPDELTYMKIILRNMTSETIQFNIAKEKINKFIRLNLYNENVACQEIPFIKMNNMDVLQNGCICHGSEMSLEIFFGTIDRATLHF